VAIWIWWPGEDWSASSTAESWWDQSALVPSMHPILHRPSIGKYEVASAIVLAATACPSLEGGVAIVGQEGLARTFVGPASTSLGSLIGRATESGSPRPGVS